MVHGLLRDFQALCQNKLVQAVSDPHGVLFVASFCHVVCAPR